MDNNKSLLNEATIKRFMKLASLKPLSNDFVMRLSETETKEPVTEEEAVTEEEEPEVEAVSKTTLDEGGVDYNEDDEVSPEDLGGGDLDLPEEGAPEEGAPMTLGSVESALESGLNALVAELEAGIPGLELSVDGNGEEDLGGEELPGEGEEVGLGGPPPEDIDVALAERKIVETVVARVASRLKNRVQKERIAEALTAKIFQSLSKK